MLPALEPGIKNREPLRRAELIRVAQYAFIFFLGDLAGPP
jgi:hypothetical protein